MNVNGILSHFYNTRTFITTARIISKGMIMDEYKEKILITLFYFT